MIWCDRKTTEIDDKTNYDVTEAEFDQNEKKWRIQAVEKRGYMHAKAVCFATKKECEFFKAGLEATNDTIVLEDIDRPDIVERIVSLGRIIKAVQFMIDKATSDLKEKLSVRLGAFRYDVKVKLEVDIK